MIVSFSASAILSGGTPSPINISTCRSKYSIKSSISDVRGRETPPGIALLDTQYRDEGFAKPPLRRSASIATYVRGYSERAVSSICLIEPNIPGLITMITR